MRLKDTRMGSPELKFVVLPILGNERNRERERCRKSVPNDKFNNMKIEIACKQVNVNISNRAQTHAQRSTCKLKP